KITENRESRPPFVFYSPVDAGPIEREMVEALHGSDHFYAYTEFGSCELMRAAAEVREKREDFQFPNQIEVIPHGVDTDTFYPIEDDPAERRAKARLAVFPEKPELKDAFIVLNANRNQPRKRIDITMQGFAEFAKDKPENVKLYLHMGVEDQGWNLLQLARRLDIEKRLLLSTTQSTLPHFTTESLNLIYNACEVGINTASGEGWGLVGWEHAATGAAQIVPGVGPSRELWKDVGVVLEPDMEVVNHGLMTDGALFAPTTVAAALESLYANRDELERRSQLAKELAWSPQFHWANISERWDEVFQRVLSEPRPNPPKPALPSKGV
ncbi:MAG: glycosyltransferase, partial [Verrucomicrobiota bacterium]